MAIDSPGDGREDAADRVADQVTSSERTGVAPPAIGRVTSPSAAAEALAPESVVQTVTRPGLPLSPDLRHDMERRFGHDFGRVRIHAEPAVARSADEVNARAYTVGHHIVFGSDGFMPSTREGARLLAHELTHVIQQDGPGSRVDSGSRALLQRKEKGPAPKKPDPRLEAAKAKLQAKFGIKEFTETADATWAESQVTALDTAFSKMSKAEQAKLKGLTLHRVKEIASPPGLDPKFKIAGETIGTSFIQFTAKGFGASTPLHEAGHLLRNNVRAEIGSKSKEAADEDAARKKLPVAGPRAMIDDMSVVKTAAVALRDSDDDERHARTQVLDDAVMASEAFRMGPEITAAPNARDLLDGYARLDTWVDSVRALADAKAKGLREFVALVNGSKLAKSTFRPFTKYVAANWPAKPNEFLVECYASWRNDPGYMKSAAKPLFAWFEKGGHLR